MWLFKHELCTWRCAYGILMEVREQLVKVSSVVWLLLLNWGLWVFDSFFSNNSRFILSVFPMYAYFINTKQCFLCHIIQRDYKFQLNKAAEEALSVEAGSDGRSHCSHSSWSVRKWLRLALVTTVLYRNDSYTSMCEHSLQLDTVLGHSS